MQAYHTTSFRLACMLIFLLLKWQLPAQEAADALVPGHRSLQHPGFIDRNYYADFDLKLLLNGGQRRICNDSTKASLVPVYKGDAGDALCRQLYRTFGKTDSLDVDYETCQRSNRLSVAINAISYEACDVSFENTYNESLVGGLEAAYAYQDKPLKILTLRVTKTIRMQVDETSRSYQEVVKTEGRRSRHAKALRKPVFLLPGSTLTFFVY